MTEDLDELAAINADLHEFYEKLAQEEIPDDLRSAIAKGWELVLEPVQTHVALAYPKHKQREDRKRLVPLSVALNVLDEFEENLVQTHVKDPTDLIWKGYKKALATFEYLKVHWREIWQGVKIVFNLVEEMEINLAWIHLQKLWSGVAAALGLLLFAWRKENFSLCIETVAKSRDRHAEKIRRWKLPQIDGARYARRKRKRL